MATRATHRRAFLRSSLEIELTFPAFRLPGVYDRKLDANYQRCHASDNEQAVYRRVFLQHEGFTATKRHVAAKRFGPFKKHRDAQHHAESLRDAADDLRLVDMSELNHNDLLDVEGDDNTDGYSKVRNVIFRTSRNMNVSRLERKDINFSSIVDIDDEAFETYVTDDLAGRFGEGNYFRTTMLLVIIINSVVIGMQTDAYLSRYYSNFFDAIDSVFLSIFIMEILFKWYYAFVSFWKSAWNITDFLLVVIALLAPYISFSQSSRILRMIRIARALRSLRSVNALQGMYTVLQTIIRSMPDMANIIFLCVIVMFIFAVIGVTLFETTLPNRFGDIGTTMFTLFILMTQDGWVKIFDQLEAKNMFSMAAVYSCVWITLGGFVFANLIVAVVVTNLDVTYDKIKRQIKQKYRKLKPTNGHTSGQPSQRVLANVADDNDHVYRTQIPYELPDFDRITGTKLQKYFLVLSIIEENLKEYLSIKEQLNEILLELKMLNSERQDDAPLDADEEEDSMPDLSDEHGDPLSRLIMQR